MPDLAKYSIWVKLGYGFVASSYRREGYGARMAAEDVDQAREFFIARIGKPQRTFLHGASYGGLVSAKLLELYAKNADGSLNYDGALLNSGLLAGATRGYEFRVDLRVVYQYYCKNLPRPDEPQYPLWMGLPTDAKLTPKDLEARIDECTGILKPAAERTEQQKQNLATITKVIGIVPRELVRHMQTATLLFRNIVQVIDRRPQPVLERGRAVQGIERRRGAQPRRRAIHRRSGRATRCSRPTASRTARCRCRWCRCIRSTIRGSRSNRNRSTATRWPPPATPIAWCRPIPTSLRTPGRARRNSPPPSVC